MTLDSSLALCRLLDGCGLPMDAFGVLRGFVVASARRGELFDVDAETRTQLALVLTNAVQPVRAALARAHGGGGGGGGGGGVHGAGAAPGLGALPASSPAPAAMLPVVGAAPALAPAPFVLLQGASLSAPAPAPPPDEAAAVDAQVEALRKSLQERVAGLKAQVVELTSFFSTDAVSPETYVWAQKLRGDFHRYVAEAAGAEKEVAAADACYAAAFARAQTHLPPTSPLRLGAALNYAVFAYEMMRDADRARRIAHDALDEAEGEAHSFDVPPSMPDTGYVMQLLRRTLARWEET